MSATDPARHGKSPGGRARGGEAPGGDAYAYAVITATLLLIALLAASLFSAWFEAETAPAGDEAAHAPPVLATIGAQRYGFPADWVGVPSQRTDGFADRIDLTLPLALGETPVELAMAIVPRGRATVSARLLDDVYVHQFSQDETAGVPGLVGKPLGGSAAYRNETVWYDPLSIAPFVAKCTRPVEGGSAGNDCLRVAPLSDRNLAIITFPESLLPSWRGFDAAIEAALAPHRR